VSRRDASDSTGSSPVPDDEAEVEKESPEGNDAEGTVTWQQAPAVHGRKGQKKKKSKGVFIYYISQSVAIYFPC